jgi:acetoin:2,6-dichlorophenolindophenol oxidoreductase subunit beta
MAPLDVATILKSVKKTGRVVLVDQAPRHSSAAAVIAGEIAEHAVGYLRALRMVTALDTPVPYSEPLENYAVPNEDKVISAVKSVLAHEAAAA